MGVKDNMNERVNIRGFLKNYLNSGRLHPEMLQIILELLGAKGRIFNEEDSYFTWSEFSLCISLLIDNNHVQGNEIANAAAIELLLLSADIIDDLVDQDNQGELLGILSNSKALTLSNVLLMESFHLLVTSSKACTTREFSNVINHLTSACNGQWKDLSFIAKEPIPTEKDYFQLINQKSVSLIQLIFDIHYLEQSPTVKQISTYIGYSGQIRNDARDILSDCKNDLITKKATLPLIKALEYSKEKDGGLLLEKLNQLDSTPLSKELLTDVKAYIKKSGAIDYCLILSKLYIIKAKELLYQYCPDKQEYIDKLIKLID